MPDHYYGLQHGYIYKGHIFVYYWQPAILPTWTQIPLGSCTSTRLDQLGSYD